jgi:hypothetical protein
VRARRSGAARPRRDEAGGNPTAALAGAAGAAIAGIAIANLLIFLGAEIVLGILSGAVVAIGAVIAYAMLCSHATADGALAALATVAFYLVLLIVSVFVDAILVGNALQD